MKLTAEQCPRPKLHWPFPQPMAAMALHKVHQEVPATLDPRSVWTGHVRRTPVCHGIAAACQTSPTNPGWTRRDGSINLASSLRDFNFNPQVQLAGRPHSHLEMGTLPACPAFGGTNPGGTRYHPARPWEGGIRCFRVSNPQQVQLAGLFEVVRFHWFHLQHSSSPQFCRGPVALSLSCPVACSMSSKSSAVLLFSHINPGASRSQGLTPQRSGIRDKRSVQLLSH